MSNNNIKSVNYKNNFETETDRLIFPHEFSLKLLIGT